jgi:phosphoribosyl 1,2-cyclic phosphodiesterase
VVYGGNTSCVEVHFDGRHIIFDAGTGLRGLGASLNARGVNSATLLMTHTHWDHIIGFPFFAPAYRPTFSLDVLAGHVAENGGIRRPFLSQMSDPMFPVPLDALMANIAFKDFRPRDTLVIEDAVTVRTAPLNHPNGAVGYRLDYDGLSVCYITDTEHTPGELDPNVMELIAGTDLFIYDSSYTEEEYPARVGWGHSTWEEGVRLCQASGAKRLVLFHHDPDHDDTIMERIEDQVRGVLPSALVARDGMEVTLRP